MSQPKLQTITKYLGTTVGRDKLYRFVQYLSKFLVYRLVQDSSSKKELVHKLDLLVKHLSLSRKLFRIGRPFEYVQNLIKGIPIIKDPVMKSCLVGKNVLLTCWMTFDFLIWAQTIGLWKSSNPKQLLKYNYQFWFSGLACGIISSVYQIHNIMTQLATVHQSKRAGTFTNGSVHDEKTLLAQRQKLLRQVFQECLDILVPAKGLDYHQLNDGVIGLTGAFTSALDVMNTHYSNTSIDTYDHGGGFNTPLQMPVPQLSPALHHHIGGSTPIEMHTITPLPDTSDMSSQPTAIALTLRAQTGQPNPVTVRVPDQLFMEHDRPQAPSVRPQGSPEEAQYIRYTAAIGEPHDFPEFIATRGGLLHAKNNIKLMIVVTMYNEDPRLFTKTLRAVHDNLRDMILNSKDPEWTQPNAWKHIMVAIVSDGRTKIHPGVVTLLSMMGGYRDGLIRKTWDGQNVTAHVFESTVIRNFDGTPTKGVTIVDNFTSLERSIVPMQLLFCLKENNAKKINSHRWFFNAFCHVIQPKVTVLIDVGTQPLAMSIYRLYKMFHDEQVAGACGEIAVEGSLKYKLWPIIAAQNFEYKMSNILDKPVEALAGYITVLPGAFSAYRYKALEGRPLQEYFKGERIEKEGNLFERNMYLAEDRILCFELVTKRDHNYVLNYDKSSVAVTDAPEDFAELIPQRRRWLNGSTFALLYALMNFGRIFTSGHSIGRKVVLFLEFVYLFANFIFGFLSLAHFYFAYHFLVRGFIKLMEDNAAALFQNGVATYKFIPANSNQFFYNLIDVLLNISRPFYILLVLMTFISSLGNSPKSARSVFMGIIYSFAFLSLVMLLLIILTTAAQLQQAGFSLFPLRFSDHSGTVGSATTAVSTLLALGATWGVYFVSSFMYGQFYHPLANMVQYTLLIPTWTVVLQVFAYANISETGWGTKGADDPHQVTKVHGGGKMMDVPMRDGIAERDLAIMPFLDDAAYVVDRSSEWEKLRDLMRKQPEAPKAVISQPDVFKTFRTYWLLAWLIINGTLLFILLVPQGLDLDTTFPDKYFTVLFFIVFGISVFRFTFSMVYLLRNKSHAANPR